MRIDEVIWRLAPDGQVVPGQPVTTVGAEDHPDEEGSRLRDVTHADARAPHRRRRGGGRR